MPKQTELAAALRAWRDRVRPEEVGLPSGGRRRATGLRREELAALAGVSVDYLVRLEQGRSGNPSAQVLAALARALRLTDAERDLLYRTAGVAPPSVNLISRHISPGVQRVLDRLRDTPVGVYTASWDLVLANALWLALFGEQGPTVRDRNLIWRFFMQAGDDMFGIEPEAHDRTATRMVSDLHAAAARYPKDHELAELIRDLRAGSAEFAGRWGTYTVEAHPSMAKALRSPTVGPLTLDCDILTTPSDLRIVVFTARTGSPEAEQIDLLRVTGIQLV